jgi:hypothetical protein
MLVCSIQFAYEAAGASRARLSLRPLFSRAEGFAQLGRNRAAGTLPVVIARSTCDEAREVGIRSARLTIFWHCGFGHFSFRTGSKRAAGNKPSMVLAEDGVSQGSGNADSQRKVWSSGGSGPRRASPGDSGCVPAHPADWRASASYRPLRAVWAVCAWALRGCARSPDPFSAQRPAHHLKELSK